MRESPRKTVVEKLPAFEVWAWVGVVVVEDDELPLEQLERPSRDKATSEAEKKAMKRGGSERLFIFMA